MNLPFARLFASAAVAASALSWAASHPVVLVNALVPRDDCTRYVDLPYGADPRQRLDVYVPRQSAKHRPPMVVFFYGGSWQSGRRQDYLFVGEALASRGFVVVIPDYRLYPQVVFPGFMQDAAMAVSWARTHAAAYGADPERVFLAGHSAGAQIALLLTTDRSWLAEAGIPSHALAGAIGLAGPYDFLPLQDATLKRIFPPAVREASQPVRFVQGGEPPVFLGVGLRDTTVDPANTERLAARLRAKGDVVEVRRYPTLTHAMTVGSLAAPVRAMGSVVATAPVLDDVVAFVNTH